MNDTIAAISTAQGEGGIGIVRISGDLSGSVLRKVFARNYTDTGIDCQSITTAFENKRMYHGYVLDSAGGIIDEVLAVFMKGPGSYTGEDVAEIHCHGGIIALRKTLERVISAGAVPAEAGEFTKRAFINGRIDLAQAEAVIDIIKAKTESAYKSAIHQLDGSLSVKVKKMRDEVLDLMVSIAVELDYPEEDERYLSHIEITERLSQIAIVLEKLKESYYTGRIVSQGLKTVIIGKPNVGKSSLFNALLRESRAIVTEIPGTTRDTIEEDLNIKGILIRLIDTAGMRQTADEIEIQGVSRSKDAFASADLALLVIDGSDVLAREDVLIIDELKKETAAVVVIINKEDLGVRVSLPELEKMIPEAAFINASMKLGTGVEELGTAIQAYVHQGRVSGENLLITNVRHKQLLDNAANEIKEGILLATDERTVELIEISLRQAYELLGEIIGETVGDDVIDEIFSRFCLGK